MKVRWVVAYIDGDGSDEWQLMRNNEKQYFDSKPEAEAFMNEHRFEKKPFYWQPTIWKEEEHVFSYPRWIAVKESPDEQK